MKSTADNLLLRLGMLTLILLYSTILAGSVVRATGSGMGCPDWPRCFGRLVPPTDISQLPADYKTRFKTGDHEIATFNAVHTWVEYGNRLFGMSSGILMLATAILSLGWKDRLLPWILFAALGLFGVVSWMGRIVVHTNLAPLNITIHMLAALVLVGASIVSVCRIREKSGRSGLVLLGKGTRTLIWILLFAALLQIILGTQVRQEIDHLEIASNDCCRGTWIDQLSGIFVAHRISAWVVCLLGVTVFFVLRAQKDHLPRHFNRLRWAVPAILAAEYGVGVGLARWALPPMLQPVHMMLAALLFGAVIALLTGSRPRASPLRAAIAAGTVTADTNS